MGRRSAKELQKSQDAFDEYVRSTPSSGGAASEIEKAKGLLDSGAITQVEYDALKAKVFAG